MAWRRSSVRLRSGPPQAPQAALCERPVPFPPVPAEVVGLSRVAEGVSFGLEMIERAPRSELPPAHFGLSAGPVIYQGGDYFGRTVNTAARVAAYAAAGEVLVTDDVVRNCAGDGLEFTSLGTVRLKGVPGPVLLHRATPIGVRSPE